MYIILPAYNESTSIKQLLDEIDSMAATVNEKLIVVVVDDGSNDNTVEIVKNLSFTSIELRIISLLYNLGHQAAIAQGILFTHSQGGKNAIIMDGDGEDDPHAIPELLRLKENDIVQVRRGKRHESFLFRMSYSIYRMLFYMIAKKKMNYGNFCMISERVIEVLIHRSFVHFAAFLSKLNFRTAFINSDRRARIGGKTKMSMSNLVHHAFRSFAEYGESFLFIFLRLFILLFVFFIITIGYIIYLKIFTSYPILGWSSTFGVGLLSAALICVGFFVTGVLQLNLTQRQNFPPQVLYKTVR